MTQNSGLKIVPTRCCVVVCYWECVAGRGVGFSTVTSACACSGGWVILTQSSQHPQLCDENFEVHKRSRVLRANVHHEDLKVHKRSRVLRANGSQALTNVESHLHLSSNWYYIKCQDYSHQKRIKTLLFATLCERPLQNLVILAGPRETPQSMNDRPIWLMPKRIFQGLRC